VRRDVGRYRGLVRTRRARGVPCATRGSVRHWPPHAPDRSQGLLQSIQALSVQRRQMEHERNVEASRDLQVCTLLGVASNPDRCAATISQSLCTQPPPIRAAAADPKRRPRTAVCACAFFAPASGAARWDANPPGLAGRACARHPLAGSRRCRSALSTRRGLQWRPPPPAPRRGRRAALQRQGHPLTVPRRRAADPGNWVRGAWAQPPPRIPPRSATHSS